MTPKDLPKVFFFFLLATRTSRVTKQSQLIGKNGKFRYVFFFVFFFFANPHVSTFTFQGSLDVARASEAGGGLSSSTPPLTFQVCAEGPLTNHESGGQKTITALSNFSMPGWALKPC